MTEPNLYNMNEKIFWWFRFWGSVLIVSGFAWAVAQWGVTRASVGEVREAVKPLETKERVKEIESRVNSRLNKNDVVLGNVRDNLLILMDRQKVEAKPIPSQYGVSFENNTP